jgi:hypothetical protein
MNDRPFRVVRTKYGDVSLNVAGSEELATVSRCWPFGLHPGLSPDAPLRIGFQLGDRPLRCIKFQQADFSEADARHVLRDNMALIASALPDYLRAGHLGVLAPVPYFRPKPTGRVETGIAYFCGPIEPDAGPSGDQRFDEYIGRGATAMMVDLQRAIVAASKVVGIQYQYFMTMEKRDAGVIGRMAFRFLTVGTSLMIVDQKLPQESAGFVDDTDQMWGFLARAGLTSVSYAAMTPAAVSEN